MMNSSEMRYNLPALILWGDGCSVCNLIQHKDYEHGYYG